MSAHVSRSPQETKRIAARLAARLQPGSVVALHGPLGSGKTVFVKGLAAALDVTAPVTSPSFSLVNEYDGRLPLYHVDLYRTSSSLEVELLDLDPYLHGSGVTVIEWAERAEGILPDGSFHVAIELTDDGSRRIIMEEVVS